MRNKFTKSASKALDNSLNVAKSFGHNYVGTEHLLIALVKTKGVASEVMRENGVEEEKLSVLIEEMLEADGNVAVADRPQYTPRAKKIIENSISEAERLGASQAGTEHLLIALLKETDCLGVRLLNTRGINVQKLYVDLLTATGQDVNSAKNEYMMQKGRRGKSATPVLDQYSRNLTEYAKEGRLDPVIGRDREITRLIEILSRRTKNNPCLVGEPGVGKTAVVEGLAQKIAVGDVPDIIKDKKVLTLDLSGMVAGSKYRGEFEERIKRAIKEVTQSGNVLLFIDEIHTIIGAGGAEGALDAANILKPSLARGELQLIGATTLEEYRKYIEKDAALERRFQPVDVNEPDTEETIAILYGLKERYEEHHGVEISDSAVVSAVKMSERYVNDRFLPDKAIDVIDEACARVSLSKYLATPELRELEENILKWEKEKEDAIRSEDYKLAGELKKRQAEAAEKIDSIHKKIENERKKQSICVDDNDIAAVIADWTKIPVQKLQEAETERLKKLEQILHERVVGQKEAVEAVSKAVRRGRVGLKDPDRPIGSFLFLGPTGVGKTELSKALAEALFGNENAMIRIDMSEYMEPHSVSKLIGSPPGYVGFDEGGQLTEKIRRKPYSVILLDEIEKAHPDVMNMLLQILDDGRLTDAQGRTVNFKNTVIIMTSNIGARLITDKTTLGFASEGNKKDETQKEYETIKKDVMGELKKQFRPEFINRIDEIIVFHKLNNEDIRKIMDIMLNQLKNRLTEQEIDIEIDESVKQLLIEKGTDINYGARPLKRTIQNVLEDKIAEAMLDGKIKPGKVAKVIAKDGEVQIQ